MFSLTDVASDGPRPPLDGGAVKIRPANVSSFSHESSLFRVKQSFSALVKASATAVLAALGTRRRILLVDLSVIR